MRHEQPVQSQVENSSSSSRKGIPQQTRTDGGSNWQFKILVVIIGLGVLMLILKSLGVV